MVDDRHSHTQIMTENTHTRSLKKLGVWTSLACSMAWAGPIPTPTHTAQEVPGSRNMFRGDFENSSISSYQYLPGWEGWEFGRDTGIVREGRAFAAGLQFSQGTHGLFLQKGNSSAERFTNLDAGAYVLSFNAANRVRNGRAERQLVRVFIDDREVFDNRFFHSGMRRIFTLPFNHTGGRVKVRFVGRERSGDNSALIDHIRFERVGLWNESATWGGSRPSSINNNVRIPRGVRVAIPEGLSLRSGHIHVQGTLSGIGEGGPTTTMTCRSVLVDGTGARFELGTNNVPHDGRFVIEMNGTNRTFDIEGFGNKFIGAQNGGTIEMQGRDVTPYTQLAESASSGQNQILVQGRLQNWFVGNDIVVSSTTGKSRGWNRNDRRRITRIENVGGNTRLTLDRNLTHPHLGRSYSTRDNVAPTRTWNYETRATVAILNRSIRINGNPGGNGFGGHMMIMGAINGNSRAGNGRVEDVRLFGMGQRSLVGRYPWHWHMMAEDGRFQYIRDCVIDNSENRAITIHGSHNTTVTRNFALSHLGHGIFLEDGAEEGNTITENVVMLSRKPRSGQEILQSDNGFRSAQNETPSAFWITNPKNTIDRNIVAGTEGVAYWFALSDNPHGLSASDSRLRNIDPRSNPITSFSDNVAHSSRLAFDINDAVNSNNGNLNRNVPYGPSQTPQYVDGFKAFGNWLGLYAGLGTDPNEVIYDDNELIDNNDATMFASYQNVQDSLFVFNPGGTRLSDDRGEAIRLYDGPGRFLNCHFENYNQTNASIFRQGGGAINYTNWLMEGSSFDHSGRPRINISGSDNSHNMDVVVDVDGTLTGIEQASVVTQHAILRTPDDPPRPSNWTNAYISEQEFNSCLITFPGTNNRDNIPDLNFVRVNDQTGDRVRYTAKRDGTPNIFMAPMVNSDYRYAISFAGGQRPSGRRMTFLFADGQRGDSVEFRIADIGNRGVTVNISEANSLADMRRRSGSSFFKDGSTLHFKFVRGGTPTHRRVPVIIRWNR